MNIALLSAAVNWDGYFNGLVFGAFIGLVIGIVYKLCFSGPGRQA